MFRRRQESLDLTSTGKGYFGDLDEIYFPYLWQAGGDIVDADGNLTLDSDAALKAAEFVYSLKTEGYPSGVLCFQRCRRSYSGFP